jgi:hypothetical protein
MVHIWYERGDFDVLKQLSRAQIDVDRNKLLQFLDVDYRFRGPHRALNREMQAQQLGQFFAAYKDWLTSDEVRELMKISVEAIGIRGVDKIVTRQGGETMKQLWEQKVGLQQAQGAVQGQAAAGAEGEMKAPASAPPDQAKALQQQTEG